MSFLVVWRGAPRLVLCFLVAAAWVPARAAQVDLFAAIESNQIGVTVIPRDATRVTLKVENKTDQPVSIQLPGALAAVPVLAQFQFPQNPPAANPAPQNLGIGFPGQNAGNQRIGQNNVFQNNPFNQPPFQANGLFNVPPGRIVKVKVPALCLEHGKPDPSPRMAYEIRALETVTRNPEVRELLQMFASGKYSQRVAQLAAWHLTDDMSWQELADQRQKHLNGKSVRLYRSSEVERAQEMIRQLPSRQKGNPGKRSANASVSLRQK